MKKIILFIIPIIFVISASKAQKAFEKGKFIIDAGIGVALYVTKTHHEYDAKVWNGSALTTARFTKDTIDAAASSIIPISLEYGVSNWFAIGARFGYAKYIAGADSTNNNIKPTVKAIDADILFNFHLIKSKHFDMPISVMIGYSNFKYQANNPDTDPSPAYNNGNAIAKDNGLNYGIALVPRIYFGNHIGIFFNLGYMGYNYPSLLFSNNSDSNLNNDNNRNEVYKLKGNGGTIGMGLVVKL